MFVGALPLLWRLSILLVAGVAAGIANGVAGGGTFITFPTLLGLGIPALQANLSTSVGVVPSYLGSLRVFRRQLAPHKQLILSLVPSCVLGAATGCALLLNGSASTFRSIVPWLIGAGTVLFATSPLITKRLAHVEHDHPARRWALFVGIFLVSVYGGYFGAGLGILLLAVMALALPLEIYELQGLRNALSIVINVSAAIIFIVHGHLAVQAVVMLLIGTLIGGWLGALLIVRLSPTLVRLLVIIIGAATTIKLAIS
ncbi:MAG TPA: sulfite exporter TauE/SafE family protein [Acidimicrobiales bacterium]|nr:sulfite exporter TauE/SafE family protein [Acidimicrobiales bacterium]